MQLTVRESRRWLTITRHDDLDAGAMREAMLRGDCTSDFVLLQAPVPAFDPTWLAIWGNDDELLIGAALLDSTPARNGDFTDDLEILLDPYGDGLGWFQFVIGLKATSPDDVLVCSHLPYHNAHSSSFPETRVRRVEQHIEDFSRLYGACRCRWVFAWFALEEVFRTGDACGLNVSRYRPYTNEYSSWNYASGNGGQDSSGCGRLYRGAGPVTLSEVTATLEGNRLHVSGTVSNDVNLSWQFLDPFDEGLLPQVGMDGRHWQGTVVLPEVAAGRYRLSATTEGRVVEPAYLAIDVPTTEAPQAFVQSVTYDPPMSIYMNHFTPERLYEQMRMLAEAGIGRVHWIEYGDFSSFWDNPKYLWAPHYPASVAACGDLLTCAVEQAHRNRLELIADLKVFDLAYNSFFTEPDGVSTVREIEGWHSSAIPEIAANQEWTMQANLAWPRTTDGPVTRICLYSERPLPEIDPARVTLLVSEDNITYQPVAAPFIVCQGTRIRPHQRWTPAGVREEAGTRTDWFLELSGLEISAPFAAVAVDGAEFAFTHRGYLVAEAWTATGSAALTVATNGNTEQGFSFWKEWTAWANHNELLLNRKSWPATAVGLTFQEMTNISALPEPCYPGARAIWLERIRRILEAGADGVSIRTLCHHNGMDTYLKYAFAPPVMEAFRARFGRDPAMTAEDYEAIRRIRGEAYTAFLRDARILVDAYGKKLILQFESGMEVPPDLHCRMQIHWDWTRWIEEELLDEIHLKWWQAESPFIHERLLPLARQRDIPVHLISFCLSQGVDRRALELYPRIALSAVAQGFAGFNYYEHRNLMEMNPSGRSYFKGLAEPAIRATHRALLDAGERSVTCAARKF